MSGIIIKCPKCGMEHPTHEIAIKKTDDIPGFSMIGVGWRCLGCGHEWGNELPKQTVLTEEQKTIKKLAIKISKLVLFHALMEASAEEYTNDDIEILSCLAKDREVQAVFEKARKNGR